jgi:histidinol-phosphate aminotransferase
LSGYPAYDGLYADLVERTGLPREQLLLTPGSDAAFRCVFQAFVAPGDTVAMIDPSYAMYAVYADLFAANAIKVPVGADLQPDAGALVEAVGQARVAFLANPNQPTGAMLGEDVLRAVLARASETGALVVVDEAYYPFSRSSLLEWAAREANLVVTRTFSKAAGLAGLRLGFVAGEAGVVGALAKVRSVFDVTSFTAHAARVVLAHPEVMDDYVEQVGQGRTLLAERARALGLEPLDSPTNFVLIRVAARMEPARLIAALRERGWIVRGPFAAEALSDCIRVTLGPPELMQRFTDVLTEVLDA